MYGKKTKPIQKNEINDNENQLKNERESEIQSLKKTKIVLISNEFSLKKISNYKKYGIDLLCPKSADFNPFINQIKQLQFREISSLVLKGTFISLIILAICFFDRYRVANIQKKHALFASYKHQ